jgi:type VI secretion system protein ImpJ
MRMLNKPVWSEGMYLGPHHFQVQNRYFEDVLNFVTESLWCNPWGFAALEFDQDALRNGTFSLTHARGLFPDGLSFDVPASDPPIPSLDFGTRFSPVADHLTLSLAVPALVQDGANTSSADGREPARYLAQEQKLPDQNTGLDEKPIQVGRKNLSLMVEADVSKSCVSLPVARVVRDGSGHFEADPGFVPPSLRLGASPTLPRMLQRLLEIIDDKTTVFMQEQEQRHGVFQAGMSARHVAQYWFLHALNTSLPALRHFLLSQHAHPQEVFREMLRLAGALCTFGLEVHPRSLPIYNHGSPGPSFAALDEHIRRHLEIVLPSGAIRIPLRMAESCLYLGEVSDERCLGPGRWILEIRSSTEDADLIARVPQLTKVCSARFVVELIRRALPGLSLRHLSVPPSQIAAKVESQYFSIERAGPCWEHIVQTRQVGFYLPGEIPVTELSLIVVPGE